MMLKSLCFLTLLIGVLCRQVPGPWGKGIVGKSIKHGTINGSDIPPNAYISYGREVLVGEFPWMTYIDTKKNDGSGSSLVCGGSLISDKHVITAAHCVVTARYLEDVTIIVGDYNTNTFPKDCDVRNRCTKNHKTRPASVTLHQNYDSVSISNDIALLRLEAHVNIASIPPINLPPFDIDDSKYENAPLTVAGWGRTESSGTNLPNILRATEVNLKTRERCYSIYYLLYPKGHLCAGKPDTLTNFCKGDSGGPLMMYYQHKYYVSGLVSFYWKGPKCGASKATYYTNVFKYMQWINWAMKQ